MTENSQAGDARRTAILMAEAVGFDEIRMAELAIVATELSTNLIRHAKSGQLILRTLTNSGIGGLELLAVDRGPGMINLPEAMRDGYSSGGTQGTGLGAIRRLATDFDIFTIPQAGTAMVATVWAKQPGHTTMDFGAVCLPTALEESCGDAFGIFEVNSARTLVMLADGLGHGLLASEASARAVQLLRENLHLEGGRLLETLHAGLKSTRGAAIAIADLRNGQRELRYTGVGNISGMIITDGVSRSMVSHNGTVGFEMRRIQEFIYPWSGDSLLIMHSDGLSSRWQFGDYPGLRAKHPSIIAGVLHRDHRREKDDVTVFALREHRKTFDA